MKRALMIVVLLVVLLTACAAQAQTMVCVVHKGEYVWVRDQPSKEGAKVGTIRYGYEVEVFDIVNQYAHMTFNGLNGYVDVSYLELPIKETVYTVVSHGPLNRRETPDGRFLGKIKEGARLSVLGWRYSKSGELWAKAYGGGYVKAQYLELR